MEKHARVKFGDPTTTIVPIWVTFERTISVLDDEYIKVAPRAVLGGQVADFPGEGRMRFEQIRSIE